MKLVPFALMYLGSLAFLGVETAPLDVASEFRKKWNQWALSRGKRELRGSSSQPAGVPDSKSEPVPIASQPLDEKDASRKPEARGPNVARPRVKRQGLTKTSPRGCRFGTCTMQNLAHQIYQYTDKDKDTSAPPKKLSPQGYGRRRRRSLPEAGKERRTLLVPELAAGKPQNSF